MTVQEQIMTSAIERIRLIDFIDTDSAVAERLSKPTVGAEAGSPAAPQLDAIKKVCVVCQLLDR